MAGGLELDDFQGSFQQKSFYDSIDSMDSIDYDSMTAVKHFFFAEIQKVSCTAPPSHSLPVQNNMFA